MGERGAMKAKTETTTDKSTSKRKTISLSKPIGDQVSQVAAESGMMVEKFAEECFAFALPIMREANEIRKKFIADRVIAIREQLRSTKDQ